jgi:hypothetical protein
MPIFTDFRLRIFCPPLFFALRFSAHAFHRRIRKAVLRRALAGAGWICGGWRRDGHNADEATSAEPLCRIVGDQRATAPLC